MFRFPLDDAARRTILGSANTFREKYVEETIIVQFPGESSQLLTYRVAPLDSDADIAKRLSHRLRAGTVLTIEGAKWRIEMPDQVTLVYDPVDNVKALPPKPRRSFEEWARKVGPPPSGLLACRTPPLEIKPGDVWKPKDPRRKTSFTVLKVEGGEVYTDDGRTIQLSRMSRYERVTP